MFRLMKRVNLLKAASKLRDLRTVGFSPNTSWGIFMTSSMRDIYDNVPIRLEMADGQNVLEEDKDYQSDFS